MNALAIAKITQLLQAATLASTAVDVASSLFAAAGRVSAALQKAHAEGRVMTDEELAVFVVEDEDARKALEAHIAQRQAQEGAS